MRAGEILGWAYVAVKILGIAALVTIAVFEAWRFRRGMMLRRRPPGDGGDGSPPEAGPGR